ncbi:MAG TPA: PspC domain-containing protein [Actinophytocola sp.]|uniref:PspC domain-containing protein n=1 Tax=Actinophytocola sp. TaxID=1872138 RepID=UPI002DDD67B1|nr:PspC domain-containing protein [Actinophytocola sp.]HEV2781626.1 PspC domain-containing protein [Actinophytocola sp.]
MSNYIDTENTTTPVRKLRRSRDDRMVAGVCGGLAKLLGVDTAIVRVVFAAATILGVGTGALLYLVCWMIVPEED